MAQTVKVTIKSPDRPDIEENVEKPCTVKKVRDLAAKAGTIPPNRHRLLRVDGKQLIDEGQSFEEDLVVQLHHAIQLWIRLPSGNAIAVLADPMDTILTVKGLIQLETRVPVEEQMLTYDIYELNNEMYLVDYGFENESSLMLQPPPLLGGSARK